ncbi:GNAT family N-acetyltransferase [Bacillus daqingensis]|uniref:GNAT family N-acetyltransferase n=1 Tax=Bacillus daqingensis TaxID=872396 RepID=A0ABV9NY31_9BACI
MHIRNMTLHDYDALIGQVNEWWGGRQMSDMLPRLFVRHFKQTCFIVESDGNTCGFLVGFLSQADPQAAYIHFVGIDPAYRRQKLARELYQMFCKKAMEQGRTDIYAVTSPINKTSIAFHQANGFSFIEGTHVIDGIPVHADYDGSGKDRVCFVKKIWQTEAAP